MFRAPWDQPEFTLQQDRKRGERLLLYHHYKFYWSLDAGGSFAWPTDQQRRQLGAAKDHTAEIARQACDLLGAAF